MNDEPMNAGGKLFGLARRGESTRPSGRAARGRRMNDQRVGGAVRQLRRVERIAGRRFQRAGAWPGRRFGQQPRRLGGRFDLDDRGAGRARLRFDVLQRGGRVGVGIKGDEVDPAAGVKRLQRGRGSVSTWRPDGQPGHVLMVVLVGSSARSGVLIHVSDCQVGPTQASNIRPIAAGPGKRRGATPRPGRTPPTPAPGTARYNGCKRCRFLPTRSMSPIGRSDHRGQPEPAGVGAGLAAAFVSAPIAIRAVPDRRLRTTAAGRAGRAGRGNRRPGGRRRIAGNGAGSLRTCRTRRSAPAAAARRRPRRRKTRPTGGRRSAPGPTGKRRRARRGEARASRSS